MAGKNVKNYLKQIHGWENKNLSKINYKQNNCDWSRDMSETHYTH